MLIFVEEALRLLSASRRLNSLVVVPILELVLLLGLVGIFKRPQGTMTSFFNPEEFDLGFMQTMPSDEIRRLCVTSISSQALVFLKHGFNTTVFDWSHASGGDIQTSTSTSRRRELPSLGFGGALVFVGTVESGSSRSSTTLSRWASLRKAAVRGRGHLIRCADDLQPISWAVVLDGELATCRLISMLRITIRGSKMDIMGSPAAVFRQGPRF